MIGLLSDYQSRLVPVIRAHGGAVDKFMGDGIMATFGAAARSETYAADALRCVDALMAAVEEWNAARAAEGAAPLRIGAAVATGRVVFGAVGDADRLEYTVIGDAVNLAAKLEKHTKQEGVRALTTTDALDRAGRQGYAAPGPRETRRARRLADMETPQDLVVLAD